MLSIAGPVGVVASCSAVNCASPGYAGVTARLVAVHGIVATYTALGTDVAGSAVKVAGPFDVRYPARDAKELRVGETYRVESTGDRGNNGVSSLRSSCGPGQRSLTAPASMPARGGSATMSPSQSSSP